MSKLIEQVGDELLMAGYYGSIIILAVFLGMAWRDREWGVATLLMLMIVVIMSIRIVLTIQGQS